MNKNSDQSNTTGSPMPDEPQQALGSTYKSMHIPTIIVAVLVLAAIVGGGLWYSNRHSTTKDSGYSYHYDKSTGFFLTAKGKGFGIVVSRPDAISQPLASTQSDISSIYYVQLKGKNGKMQSDVAIAYLALKSRPYPNPVLGTTNYRDIISTTLNNPSSERYSETIANTRQFAIQVNPYPGTTTFGPAKSFTSKNIKRYAWQFDVSLTDFYRKNPTQQGKVLYILGDNGWYYVMVTAEKSNWQNNSAFFQKVLDSVKVDQ